MPEIKDHNFRVSAKLVSQPENGIEIAVSCEGRDHELTTRTVNFVSFDSFTIKRLFTSVDVGDVLKNDVDKEMYDSKVSVGIHTATWDHNLFADAINCGGLEELECSIREMFSHTVNMIKQGRFCEVTRHSIFPKTESLG